MTNNAWAHIKKIIFCFIGIVENRYSATERVLQAYRGMLISSEQVPLSLNSTAITRADIQQTVVHFVPQYDIIINYLDQCQDMRRTMENGCDIEFATSFLCAYLYSIMPEQLAYVHMVRVRDLYLTSDSTHINNDDTADQTDSGQLTQYISSSCADVSSPVIASACINKLQKCIALDSRTKAIVNSYVTYVRPRITKSNDYLLLSGSALGLTAEQVFSRVITLVYRVTGKVRHLTLDQRYLVLSSKQKLTQRFHSLFFSSDNMFSVYKL